MSMFRRWIVLILVALALPLQALAAAAMLHCGPLDGGTAAAHLAAPSDAGHGDALADAHVHHASAVGDLDDAAPVAAGHACSACAACCTLAGVPSLALDLPAPGRMEAVAADGASPAAKFLTSGVERPPRG